MRRGARRIAAAVFAGVVVSTAAVGLGAGAASAHPLGNATVNHYDGLEVSTAQVVDHAVEDAAEIPTLQRKDLIDADHDGTISAPEAAAYAGRQCAAMSRAVDLTVGGIAATFTVTRSSYSERPGAIRLVTGRLECDLTARANLARDATLAFASRWDADGVGWHEITAVGRGVTLHQSPFPAASVSDALRKYPNDLLSAPLDVTSGSMTTSPGSAASTYAAVAAVPGAGVVVRALDGLTKAFESRVGAHHLTVGLLALTVFLAMLLGAGHACLPGHGKTIMAAYLVGRRGRLRDVVAVGATVTVTHTASVLVLGLAVSASATFAPTNAVRVLAIVSGLIVTGVGVGLLGSAIRRTRVRSRQEIVELVAPAETLALVGTASAPHVHGEHQTHDHPHDRDHPHDHDHQHGPDDHGHDHHDVAPAATHSHGPFGAHSHEPRPYGKGGLIGLGVAGGLVPSPSALLVLLAAFALGRGWLGVVLVLAYGVGMAGTLTAAGLLLVRLRDRLARAATNDRFSRAARAVAVLPFVTAGLVLVVGSVLTLRAMSGTL